MAFLISIYENPGENPRVLSFTSSPIRVGRNPLNDVTIDHPFVSQWHGLLRFEGKQVSYMDLGSTNGSTVNGHRLSSQQAVTVEGPKDPIEIGPIRLEVDFGAASLATEGARLSSFSKKRLRGATVMQAGNAKVGAKTAVMPGGGVGIETGTSGADAVRLTLASVKDARASFEAYRLAWDGAYNQIKTSLNGMPEDVQPAAARELLRVYPHLSAEPDIIRLFGEMGIDTNEFHLPDPRGWLAKLSGSPGDARNQVHVGLAMERVGALMEAFSESYVELRKGMEQFGAEMGLQLATSQDGLHRAQSGADVMSVLLEWRADGSQRVSELRRSFADVALHQVAMLNGVMAGTRALLREMSPETVNSGGGALAVRVPFWARLLPFGGGVRWARYRAAHKSLVEEDRFSRVLFGKEFMRAYYTVVGSEEEGQ